MPAMRALGGCLASLMLVTLLAVWLWPTADAAAQSVRPPESAVSNAPAAPGERAENDFAPAPDANTADSILETQGLSSSAAKWREVRSGQGHTVSIPNQQAGVLIQSPGAYWIDWREADGPLIRGALYGLGGIFALLALFYVLRGRIKIEHGLAGVTIERFKFIERFGHWLLASSFILLALTGLNVLLGKEFLMPLIGKEAFAQISIAGKWVHNNVAWAFMLGLVLIFFMWVLHNLPHKTDIKWLLQGGGLFSKKLHPPARKFNAGQKLIFWGTIVFGGSISLSGLSLLFPYELPMFAKTFAVLNDLGISQAIYGEALPTELSVIQEMQYAQIWHTIVSIAMIVFIVAHIYIGSVGMQGAFDAMGSGQVDRNWALEHHSLWVQEEMDKALEGKKAAAGALPGATTPAE
ncbi:MAG: formate dehydrogenase subunit gamma [Pseudomonadota bacterium]